MLATSLPATLATGLTPLAPDNIHDGAQLSSRKYRSRLA
jgi:hypothetical protein